MLEHTDYLESEKKKVLSISWRKKICLLQIHDMEKKLLPERQIRVKYPSVMLYQKCTTDYCLFWKCSGMSWLPEEESNRSSI